MRFWDIFRKTRFQPASSTNVSTLLTQHATRKKAMLGVETPGNWKARTAILASASVSIWGLLAIVDNRLEDPERCRHWAWEPGWRQVVLDIACSRLGSHVGPFHVSNLVKAGIVPEALRRLQTDLDDHEKLFVLSRIEQQTSRGIVCDADYRELIRQLSCSEGGIFDALLRIILDVLSKRSVACPDEIENIIGTRFGSMPRDEEVKAWVIYLLLLHPENAQRARCELLVMDYLELQGKARYEPVLWTVKRELTSGETHDILHKTWKLVQEIDPSLPDRERRPRETLNLEQKIDFRCLETTLEGTFLFTVGVAIFQAQAMTFVQIAVAMKRAIAGVGAITALETFFRGEEFFNRFTSVSPYVTTFGYAVVHPLALALTWKYAPLALWPLAFIRLVKDPLSDSARLLEDPKTLP